MGILMPNYKKNQTSENSLINSLDDILRVSKGDSKEFINNFIQNHNDCILKIENSQEKNYQDIDLSKASYFMFDGAGDKVSDLEQAESFLIFYEDDKEIVFFINSASSNLSSVVEDDSDETYFSQYLELDDLDFGFDLETDYELTDYELNMN